MTTTRDAHGIPHVVAGSVTEVAHEQGLAVAVDRTWQLEHARLKAAGRTASVLGAAGLEWDRFARRVQVERLGRRAYERLSTQSGGFVDAFVAGVNEGLATARPVPELDRLGVRPGVWQSWTPLAVFAAHHVLFGTFPQKLWRRHLDRVLGHDTAEALELEGVWASGSNSWVVGGSRTASGLPMIGGDPHRTFESPDPYQQVRLTCTDPDDPFDVAGFTFPGVPGVQHFAHAGEVAWAITNAMADYQDVFDEQLERRGDEVWCRTVDGWAQAETHLEEIEVRDGDAEVVEVVETTNGLVFWSGRDDSAGISGQDATTRRWEGLSLRTAADALGDVGFECLLPLLRARTSDDVCRALEGWVEPVNNLLVADVHGDVRQRVVGKVPERDEENRHRPVPGWAPEHRWRGWVKDLPQQTVGPDEHLVTANHRMTADFDRVGVEFAPPGRANRIDALLTGRSGLTLDDFAAIHRDVLAGQPAALARAIARLRGLSPAGEELQAEVGTWDQHLHADSTTAAAYVAIRDSLVRRLAASDTFAELAEGLADGSPFGSLFDYWFAVPMRLQLSLANLLSERGRTVVPDADAHLAAAVEEVAADRPGQWGERHRFRPYHALGLPLDLEGEAAPELPGDNDCVRCAGAFGTDTAVRGSVARYVWDLAGFASSGWVVPLGASGDPASPRHDDQLPLWLAGELAPVGR